MNNRYGIFVNVADAAFDQDWTLDESEIDCENYVESETDEIYE